MRQRHLLWIMAGGIAALGLAGATALPVRAAATKAAVSAAAGAATGERQAAASPRCTAAKPDPFQPFVETDLAAKGGSEQGQGRKEAGKRHSVSPLQQREIGQFRLVGIAGNDRKRMAMVEDGAAKKIYPLVVGTYIGPNDGRVAAILPDRVIIEEPSEEPAKKGGQAPRRRIVMTLHKEE